MNDCEFWGVKHKLKLVRATDHFLLGDLHFQCVNCPSRVVVDRFYFYISIRGNYNKERKPRGT